MAEQNAAPAEATETQTGEAAGTESATELRDALIAKLKAREAEGESSGETIAKPKDKPPAKPKRGETDKPGEADDTANAADTPELAALKAERRGFAKHKRKWEAQAATREAQLVKVEQRANQLIAAFDKDPIAFLKAHKVDVRGTLLRMANEDSEDPRDKQLREIQEEQKRDKAEREREKTERALLEQKAEQRTAEKQLETELATAWGKAEVDDYPTVAAALEPEHVALRAREIMVEHYAATGKELAPTAIFATMERELAPLKGKLANAAKRPKPPEQVRSASDKRKAEIPEAPTKRERPSEDVTRRVTREQSVGRTVGFDKDSLRDRLIAKARDAAR